MAGFWLRNLVSYSVQIAVILLVGGAVLELFRVQLPIYRLRFWQALLILCLALPFAQPWTVANVQPGVSISAISTTTRLAQRSTAPALPLARIAGFGLVAGTVARFGFLILGFYRLRRYRRQSERAPAAALDLRERMGIAAEIRVLEKIPGPVTFGVFRPVVILPSRWIGNESILRHELIHVRRKDWVATVGEEFIRAVFWFHPLVWWAIAKIQLAREEVVDREVVAAIASPHHYLETLLEIAAAKSGLELAPAPLFLRSRHLRQRVASILKEVHMSRKHLSLSTAGFTVAIAAAAWFAIYSFPLQAAPQQTGPPAESGLRITHRTLPQYPADAKENHVEGSVAMQVEVDEHGLVSSARAISGPQELRQAALTAVRQWTFAKPSTAPFTSDVVIAFRLNNGTADLQSALAAQNLASAEAIHRVRVGGSAQSNNLITKITPFYPPEAKQARMQGSVKLNVLIGTDGRVLDVVLIDGEPVLADAAISAVRQWIYRPTLLNGNPVEVVSQVDVNFTLEP